MKLIGVFGGSGSGKSTVTRLLNENLYNSLVINIDTYMRQYMIENKEKLISKMNYKIKDKYWTTYFFQDYKEITQWVNMIEPHMQTVLEKIISENENYVDFIILDWMFLPIIPLWNKCDFSICVKCDENIKLNRLIKRLEKENRLEKWKDSLLNRMHSTSLDEFGHMANYTIFNNGTPEDLQYSVISVLKANTTAKTVLLSN